MTLDLAKQIVAERHGYASWSEISRKGVVSQPREEWYDEVALIIGETQYREGWNDAIKHTENIKNLEP